MAGDPKALAAAVKPAMATFWNLLDGAGEGASVVRLGGVLASISPAVPERSLFNAVMYLEPDGLSEHLDELETAYDDAGIKAWTVWAPSEDRELTAELARRGHLLDASPDALALSLEELAAPEVGDLEWTLEGNLDRLIAINDAAYPWPEDTFVKALGRMPADGWHVYVASLGGDAVSCLMTYDADGNTRPEFVATLPEARGQGISARLLGLALSQARDRGCRASTIHASKMGQPVYERLGYRVVSSWEMWERRSG